MNKIRAELNGHPVSRNDFRYLALVNYGHFTSMQVRNGSVRGLPDHLERLDRSTQEMFGTRLEPRIVLDYMRHILNRDSCSMRVTVFSRGLNFDKLNEPAGPDVLITISDPVLPNSTPIRVQSIEHKRLLPHLKHLGTLDLFYFPRLAQKNGFDDVLFVDAEGSISEGSIWNVGFFTGSQVVFPSAPALPGITMHLLQAGLSAQGISWTVQDIQLKDLVSFRSAFLMNSASVGQPIACIDDHTFVVDTTLTGLVMECYETNPWETIG